MASIVASRRGEFNACGKHIGRVRRVRQVGQVGDYADSSPTAQSNLRNPLPAPPALPALPAIVSAVLLFAESNSNRLRCIAMPAPTPWRMPCTADLFRVRLPSCLSSSWRGVRIRPSISRAPAASTAASRRARATGTTAAAGISTSTGTDARPPGGVHQADRISGIDVTRDAVRARATESQKHREDNFRSCPSWLLLSSSRASGVGRRKRVIGSVDVPPIRP